MFGPTPILGTHPHGAADYLRAIGHLDVRHIGALVIAPRANLEETRRLNDRVLELGNKSRGRFYPVCSVHPADGRRSVREIERVAEAGARCLKLHPNTQAFDVAGSDVQDVVGAATDRHLPVLFDAYSPFDADQPGKFVRLALAVPDARLILAHAHGPRFAELLVYEILARYPWWRRNVWIDLSATASLLAGGPYAPQLTWVLRKVGVDRLLFGSDYPLDQPETATRALVSLGFSPAELRRIFYRNAQELLGFATGSESLSGARPRLRYRRARGRGAGA